MRASTLAALAASACAGSGAPAAAPTTRPAAPVPALARAAVQTTRTSTMIEAAWSPRVPGADRWTAALSAAIERHGGPLIDARPADVLDFCPTYAELNAPDRARFWIYLLSVMAKHESDFEPEARYREPPSLTDAQGRRIVSRGLLQLSKESANGYGCSIDDAEALHDPAVNLSCSVRILARWVSRDGRIAGTAAGKRRGGGRYWSVLWPQRKRDDIRRATRSDKKH